MKNSDQLQREASCSCGQLKARTEGQPVAIGMCHCLECQRRTGSPFGVQARFLKEQVTVVGSPTLYQRKGDTGRTVTFQFCSNCGSNVLWQPEALPNHISVAVGAFADPGFPSPGYSVYESRRHPWTSFTCEMDHYD